MEHSRLLRTIEEQNRKLETYQTKLRDVVQAYKDLSKEKLALEATVTALNQSLEKIHTIEAPSSEADAETSVASDPLNSSQVDDAEGSDGVPAVTADGGEQGNRPNEGTVEEPLKRQIATLSNSLVTVTQQKSKLEAVYFAEKKKLKLDLEEKEKCFSEERQNLLKQIQTLENDSEQWRSKVRNQQHDQETEQNNHAVMLRELQQLLTTERISKVSLETQVEDIRTQLSENQRMLQQKSDLYEKTISNLREEVSSLQAQLKTSKEASNEPSSLLMHLQKELLDLKEHEKRVVLQEQQRANDAELRLTEISHHNEERVSSLEAKVSEMSEMLGTAERARNQDQQTILKLRERILQLDLENSALASVSRSPAAVDSDEDLDVSAIVGKMLKLKERFIVACERADKPPDLYDALQLDQDSLSHDVHSKCHELYDQLREEYERYKLRAQSLLKNKGSRDSGPEQEVAVLKSQMADLRERYGILRRNFDDGEMKLKEKEEYFARAIATMTESHRAEMLQRDIDHRQKISELDAEIRRHRERTVALLAEKDREISNLRLQVSSRVSDADGLLTFQPQVPSSPEPDANEVGASSEEASAVTELLRQSSPLLGMTGESKILHFAQEQGRKEVEIATLRRQKHNLEVAIREQQQTYVLKEQERVDQILALEELVKKHERDKSRESANLEYLKNVVFHYLISTDGSGRQPMLNAIATILEFSPKEKQQVNLAVSRGWWTSKHSSSK